MVSLAGKFGCISGFRLGVIYIHALRAATLRFAGRTPTPACGWSPRAC
ncbi:hypothetical protein ACFPRL_30050 [Pseudoclavibacter helvolus]